MRLVYVHWYKAFADQLLDRPASLLGLRAQWATRHRSLCNRVEEILLLRVQSGARGFRRLGPRLEYRCGRSLRPLLVDRTQDVFHLLPPVAGGQAPPSFRVLQYATRCVRHRASVEGVAPRRLVITRLA